MVQVAMWDKIIGPGLDPILPELRGRTIAAYKAHIEQVLATAPKHQLLDWKVGDGGWEPLCSFLEVSAAKCPTNEAFPHANDRQAFFTTFLLPMSVALIVLLSSPVWSLGLVW